MAKRRSAEAIELQVQEKVQGQEIPTDVEAPAPTPDEPEAPRVPVVGETVVYHYPQGGVRPAIVVNVYDVETVDLCVMTGGQADRSVVRERVVMINVNTGADMHSVPPVVFRPAVRRGIAPGEWSQLW